MMPAPAMMVHVSPQVPAPALLTALHKPIAKTEFASRHKAAPPIRIASPMDSSATTGFAPTRPPALKTPIALPSNGATHVLTLLAVFPTNSEAVLETINASQDNIAIYSQEVANRAADRTPTVKGNAPGNQRAPATLSTNASETRFSEIPVKKTPNVREEPSAPQLIKMMSTASGRAFWEIYSARVINHASASATSSCTRSLPSAPKDRPARFLGGS